MKQFLKISFTFYEKKANKKKRSQEKLLRSKLKPFVIGNGGSIIGDYYKFPINSELLVEIMKFAKNKRCVDLHIDYIDEYSTDELRKAKLFLLKPQKTYMQNKNIYKYLCSECSCRNLISHEHISISKKINCNKSNNVFKIGEGVEELCCISVQLYEKLIIDGVNNRDFIPVKKGDEVNAYAFAPIKEYSIFSNVYKFRKCKKCGNIYAEFDKKKRNQHEDIIASESIDFSEHDVYKTVEYFDGEQKIIISPRLYWLLEQYINSEEIIPVFEGTYC